jgi:lipopolysaccharide export system permease protein
LRLPAGGVKTAAMPRLALHRIDRYIFGQLLIALVLVTAGLVALIWLTQSLRFIQVIVNRGLSPVVFVRLTLLLVPSFAATILPITCFIVVVFVYARLAGDRELTVMRAAGMSDFSLARPALALGVTVMLLCYWLNIVLVPASLKSFHDYQYQIRNQIAAFLLEPGVFTQVSNDLTVYVQSRDAQNGLLGILIEDSRDKNAPATVLARSGELQVTPKGPVVILEDGSREQVDPRTGRLDVLTFHRNVINLSQTAKSAAEDNTDPAAAPLGDLFDPSIPLSDSDRKKWLVEGQRRLSAPLTALGFTLIGLLAVLGGKFRRHGGLLRPLAAVAAVTLLVAASLAVNNFAARGLALLPLIWIVAAAPGLAAGLLLFRPRRLGSARLVVRVN